MKYKTKVVNDVRSIGKKMEKIQTKIDSLNFKMAGYLTNSVIHRDEAQIKKFRSAKKQLIGLLEERRVLSLQLIQLDFPKD